MNKKRVDEYIPKAIKLLNDYEKENDGIPQEFKGYVANFGASIIQSGLLATVCFFEKTKNNARQKKNHITYLIYCLLESKEYEKINDKTKYLRSYYENEKKTDEEVTDHVMDVAIALKLALNCFKLKQSEEDLENE